MQQRISTRPGLHRATRHRFYAYPQRSLIPAFLRDSSFTAIELLVVIVAVTGLVILAARYVTTTQRGSLLHACQNHLRQTGRMTAQYESAAMFDRIPLAGDHTAYDTNAATLDPFICFQKAQLMKDDILLSCPLGNGPIVYGPANPGSVQTLAGAPQEPTRAATTISSGTEAASNYLFTWFYRKDSPGNRAIAGDAAAGVAIGLTDAVRAGGFSPNHGDTAGQKVFGANALLRDGSVSATGRDYSLPQAQLRTGGTSRDNLWDGSFLWDGRFRSPRGTDGAGTCIGSYSESYPGE